MLKLVRSIVSVIARRFRSRAVLELENLALRHQLHVQGIAAIDMFVVPARRFGCSTPRSFSATIAGKSYTRP